MNLLIVFFLPLAVGIIMLSLGLCLTVQDFLRVARQPKIFIIGLNCQIVLFPLLALLVTFMFQMSGATAIGLILLAACPAGNMSCLITKYARGDVPLSVSLTAINSLLCMFTLPVVLFWAHLYFDVNENSVLDIGQIFFRTFLLAFLPISLGVVCNRYAPAFVLVLKKHLSRLSLVLLFAIIFGAVAAHWSLFMDNLFHLGGALTSLFILVVGSSYLIPRIFGFGFYQSKTIAIEIGTQNGAMGILIASLLTPGFVGFNDYSLASAIYGVMMYFALAPIVFVFRRLDKISI